MIFAVGSCCRMLSAAESYCRLLPVAGIGCRLISCFGMETNACRGAVLVVERRTAGSELHNTLGLKNPANHETCHSIIPTPDIRLYIIYLIYLCDRWPSFLYLSYDRKLNSQTTVQAESFKYDELSKHHKTCRAHATLEGCDHLILSRNATCCSLLILTERHSTNMEQVMQREIE